MEDFQSADASQEGKKLYCSSILNETKGKPFSHLLNPKHISENSVRYERKQEQADNNSEH